MARNSFWSGFAAGALAGVAGVLAFKRGASDVDGHVVRLEKSINIGRPVHEVFAAWFDLERLAQSIRVLRIPPRAPLLS